MTTFERNISQHCWVLHVACVWPPCCDVLRYVACCWLKFENGLIFHATLVDVVWCCSRLARVVQQCCAWACALVRFSIRNMSQHVATGWPNVCNILPPAMLRSVTFKGCDRLAGACKYWANNVGICCVEMLPSFGRDFKFYIWLEQFHLKIVENNSLRLMSLLINRTCRSY